MKPEQQWTKLTICSLIYIYNNADLQIHLFILCYYIVCSISVASQMADGCIWLQKSLWWPTRRKWERHSEPVGLLAILMILDTILPSVSAISGWFKSWSFVLVLSPRGVPQGPGLCPLLFLPLKSLSSAPHPVLAVQAGWHPPSSSLSHALLSTMGLKVVMIITIYYSVASVLLWTASLPLSWM